MRIDTPEHMNSLQKIFPLIPRALRQIQSDIDPRTFRVLGEGARAHVVHDIVMKEAEETFDEDSIISNRKLSRASSLCLARCLY